MDTNTQLKLDKAQSLAKSAYVFAVITLVIIGLSVLTKAGLPIVQLILERDLPWAERVNEAGLLLVQILPAALLFAAINQLRYALERYSEGEFFSDTSSKHVAEAGDYAVEALVAVILIVPNLTQWIQHNIGFELRVEPEYIGMLAFAIFIAVVGRILSAAAYLEQENESFV